MSELPLLERAGRRFARFAHDVVVARPALWRLFRRPLQAQFDRLAPVWEARREPFGDVLAPVFDRIAPPRKVLDLGTGTGIAVRTIAARFPEAEIVGIDLSRAMIEEARRLLPAELRPRVRFDVGDASALPFGDGEFDLVVLLNMIPFFAELARVTTAGGAIAFGFSSGPETPIYTPTDRLRAGLTPHGFATVEEFAAAGGTAVLARRARPG
jgi:SAM-dependent methyltransferase